jgi:hypothetical protein
MQVLPVMEPYPGIRSFRSDDAAVYFGREPLIENIMNRRNALNFSSARTNETLSVVPMRVSNPFRSPLNIQG